jgi:hypothetical protein
MFVCCECCVLSGRGLCDGLITRPEEPYRLWRVVVCDQETSKTRRLKPPTGLWKIQPQWVVTPRKQTNKQTSNCLIMHGHDNIKITNMFCLKNFENNITMQQSCTFSLCNYFEKRNTYKKFTYKIMLPCCPIAFFFMISVWWDRANWGRKFARNAVNFSRNASKI